MKILVHLHLFYQDMLPEMLTLLRSLYFSDVAQANRNITSTKAKETFFIVFLPEIAFSESR